MAAHINKRGFIVCVGLQSFKVYSKGNCKPQLHLLSPDPENKNDESEKKKKQKESLTDDSTDSGRILASGFSENGEYFAICDNQKQLTVWNTSTEWTKLSSRPVVKRCTALAFSHNEDNIIVSDKAGDVYKFSILDPDKPGELILGHLSMVLDVILSEDDRFVVTADRDEKIRVSHFPNGYNIHSYCLGHTDFVSRLKILSGNSYILLSGAGDGTIRVWNYLEGTLLNTHHLSTSETKKIPVSCIACSKKSGLVAVVAEGYPMVWILQVMQRAKKWTINEMCKLETNNPPWNVYFNDDDILWIFQPCSRQHVLLYNYVNNDGTITFNALNEEESCKVFAYQQISSDWEFFKEYVQIGSFYSHLHKKTYDNVQDYLSKKQERLKAKSDKSEIDKPPTKKCKVDE